MYGNDGDICSDMKNDNTEAANPDDLLFYGAFKASPIGIAVEDLEGRPLFASPALCSMLGFTEEEMRKKHCVEFSPPEDAEKDWALFEQLRGGLIDHYHLEKRFFRKDGSLIWGRLSISLFNLGASPLVVAMVEDITEKKAAQEKLQESEATLHKLAGHLIQAQEEERQRIARELHDDINQKLSMLHIDLDRLEQFFPDSADHARRELDEQRKRVSEIAYDVQAMLHRLHPSKLQILGIVAAAKTFCRELSERQGVEIDFHADGIPEELPMEISLSLFRIMQEALQNGTKHSGSRHFQVSIRGESNEIQLSVRDSGIGFDPQALFKGRGLGLTSMKERMRLVQGDLSIDSRLQCGTTIRARVPLIPRMKSAAASE
jgi:PAS domain S-box-containing protein